MERFRQCFEMAAECKKVTTMFNRFSKKYPEAWEVWGEVFEYMLENELEHYGDDGWTLWLYDDDDTHYMAIVLTDKAQEI